MKVNVAADYRQISSTQVIPGVYFGRLLSPSDVAAATTGHPEPVRTQLGSSWVVCGDVSPGLFEALQGSTLLGAAKERLTAFASPSGAKYCVLSHQLGPFQNRFLLALYDPLCAEFIRASCKVPFWYSLAGDTGTDALVWRSHSMPRELLPLQSLCMPLSADIEQAVVEEYMQVVLAMTHPGRIPSTRDDLKVQHVSLTVVPPASMLLRAAGLGALETV